MAYKNEKANVLGHIGIIGNDNIKNALNKINSLEKNSKGDISNDLKDSSLIEKYTLEINQRSFKKIYSFDSGSCNIYVDGISFTVFKMGNVIRNLETKEESNEIFPLILPINGLKNNRDMLRNILNDFMSEPINDSESMNDTLKYILSGEFKGANDDILIRCPDNDCNFENKLINNNYTFKCGKCGRELYMSDLLRLNSVPNRKIDSTLINTLEQFYILSKIVKVYKEDPKELENILFLKDGPLFINRNIFPKMNEAIRTFLVYLKETFDINLAGLEKSGMFYDHLNRIKDKLEENTFLIPSNEYIKKYIQSNLKSEIYAKDSAYSDKILFSTDKKVNNKDGFYSFVVSIPNYEQKSHPDIKNSFNTQRILNFILNDLSVKYPDSIISIGKTNNVVSISANISKRYIEEWIYKQIKDKNPF